jgi:hypothetical protein
MALLSSIWQVQQSSSSLFRVEIDGWWSVSRDNTMSNVLRQHARLPRISQPHVSESSFSCTRDSASTCFDLSRSIISHTKMGDQLGSQLNKILTKPVAVKPSCCCLPYCRGRRSPLRRTREPNATSSLLNSHSLPRDIILW